ncbi:MAG: AAA family ATPase [Aphanothece sp. CMT-3BRIN-NPC111]|jgi:hypothetical protein|nr:AAA family ATPase [Aphanothece sp. CMT-3BRIN-NPC111]
MLPVGETVLLVADPKAGKFLLAYDAAFAIAKLFIGKGFHRSTSIFPSSE